MVEVRLGYKTVDLPYSLRIHGVTEEMFDELVNEDLKAELLDGVMIVHSPAALEHDDVGGFLRSLARFYAESKKLGKVLGPDGLVHLATCRKVGPDIFFVLRTRVPIPMPKVFEGAPDWITEILSPSNRDDDLEDKLPAYQAAKVPELWFVDPENQEVQVHRRRGQGYVEKVVRKGKLYSSALEGFWINVAWLWQKELPDVSRCYRQILRGAS